MPLKTNRGFLDEDDRIDSLVASAVLKALRSHKETGVPIAVEQNGKVVMIAPEDIVLPDEDEDETHH